MWPATFQQLVEAQFNVNGFNLPYHDARALACTYVLQNNRCVDNYRLRYALFMSPILIYYLLF